ncbi:invasin [Shewanella xiamenensis]|uniref:invasin n=1 Tax=Shewanella xiamenensis TaxID=332186 RepID=UPI0035B7B6C3
MKSAYKVFLAGLCSLFLVACGGGGSISDDGSGTPPTPGVITVSLSISNSDNVSLATPAEVKATVVDSKTGPKAGVVVTFKLDNELLGTFTPSTGTQLTDAFGVATIKLDTATLAGAGNVTASIASGESATKGFFSKGDGVTNPGTGNKLKLTLINKQGQAISSISAAVPGTIEASYKNSLDEPLVGKVVAFNATLGKLSPESGTALTDAQGVAKISITAGSTEGAGKITAKVDNTEAEVLGFYTQGDEVVVKPIDAYVINLSVQDSQGNELRNISHNNPGSVIATLLKDGVPSSYQKISFNLTGQGILNPSSGTALTDLNGRAIVTLVTGTNAGAGTVTAAFSLDNEVVSDNYNFEVAGDAPGGNGEANSLSIQLTNSQTGVATTNISAGQPGKVTVTLVDKDSIPLVGKVVSFASTLGNFLPTQGTALTDSIGRASITLTAGTIEGAGEVTASYGTAKAIVGFVTAGDDIDPVEASPEISFDIYNCNGVASWDKALKNFEVCKSTDNITNDKPGIIGIKVTRSGSTQPLPQVLVSAATTLGAISPNSGTAITNAEGKAILDLYANGSVGAGEVSLKVKDATSTKAFEIGRVDISLDINTSVGNNSLPAGGSTIVDVTVFNPDGSLATGQPFTLELSSECVIAGKAVIDSPIVTNAGKGYSTYRATGCSGLDTISVSAVTGGGSVSKTTQITIDSVKVGAIEFVSATPNQLALSGTGGISGAGARSETSVVSFKLLNEIGQPASQQRVCFELSTEVGGMTLSPSPIAADYLACSNMPNPGDSGYPTDLNLPNKYAVAYTNSFGEVSVTVKSGDIPTPVKVFALWSGSTGNGHNAIISNISDELVVSTGLADNDSFSLSASILNPEAWEHDDQQSVINVLAADHFNNLVPSGTRISFRAEGGGMDGSCVTGSKDNGDGVLIPNGGCSVTWRSQNPRPFYGTSVTCPNGGFNGITTPPCTGTNYDNYLDGTNSIVAEPRPGRATITAYAIGEESFVDLNGNGLFDSNEDFIDISEAFTDHNEDGKYRGTPLPAGAVGEEFIDYNVDGTFNQPDGKYTGLLCAKGAEASCTDTGSDNFKAQLNVFRNLTLVMSGSTPYIRLVNIDAITGNITPVQPIDLTVNAPQTVYLFVSDLNNNTLPVGTTITASEDNGVISGSKTFTVGNNTSNKPLMYPFTVGLETTPNKKTIGQLTITVKTPLGEPVSISVNVIDAG